MSGALFFIFGSIFLMFLTVGIWTYSIWIINKKHIELTKSEDFRVFENLRISSTSNGRLKNSIGFRINGIVGISNDRIIIAANRHSLLLLQTEMPIILDKSIALPFEQLKMNSFNSISLITHKNSLNVGYAEIKIHIETQTKNQKVELYNTIKNWC